jgi:hypothetical protein
MQPYTTEAIINALKETNGLVSLAARRLGCSASTIYTRAHNVRAVQQTINESREELVDIAELALRSCLTKQEGWAVAFTLRTIGKNRGYVERTEITGADGKSIDTSVRVLDYRAAIAPIATGPDEDSATPGEDEDTGGGPQMG